MLWCILAFLKPLLTKQMGTLGPSSFREIENEILKLNWSQALICTPNDHVYDWGRTWESASLSNMSIDSDADGMRTAPRNMDAKPVCALSPIHLDTRHLPIISGAQYISLNLFLIYMRGS